MEYENLVGDIDAVSRFGLDSDQQYKSRSKVNITSLLRCSLKSKGQTLGLMINLLCDNIFKQYGLIDGVKCCKNSSPSTFTRTIVILNISSSTYIR